MPDRDSVETWLSAYLQRRGAAAGTVHVRERNAHGAGDVLVLRSAINIPARVQEVTRVIPKGKGMAGLAWERDRAVATCNLQTDTTGDVRPGAKAVNAQAAVAIPVRADDGDLRAVVGIAFMSERDFSDEELTELERETTSLPVA